MSAELAPAWWAIADSLGDEYDNADAFGIISSPGPRARLVVLGQHSRLIAKTHLYTEGEPVLIREVEATREVAAIRPDLISTPPLVTRDGDYTIVVTPRAIGRGPSWRNDEARRSVSRVLRQEGVLNWRNLACPSCANVTGRSLVANMPLSIFHGDCVAWNVKWDPESGRVAIFDWEFCRTADLVPAVFNDLEWILRGAAAANVSSRVVTPLLRCALAEHGIYQRAEWQRVVRMYVCHSLRNKATLNRASEDQLLHRIARRYICEMDAPGCPSWDGWLMQ